MVQWLTLLPRSKMALGFNQLGSLCLHVHVSFQHGIRPRVVFYHSPKIAVEYTGCSVLNARGTPRRKKCCDENRNAAADILCFMHVLLFVHKSRYNLEYFVLGVQIFVESPFSNNSAEEDDEEAQIEN